MTAFVGNPNLLSLNALQDEVTGSYINDAYVETTLQTSAGVDLTGMTWPVELAYVASSDGDYRAVLEADINITAGVKYIALLDAYVSEGGALLGHWEFEFAPETRRR